MNISIDEVVFISSLNDDQLDLLHSLAWQEKKTRLNEKIKEGKYPPLLNEEMIKARESRFHATIAYKNRTNTDISVAKAVVDFYCDNL